MMTQKSLPLGTQPARNRGDWKRNGNRKTTKCFIGLSKSGISFGPDRTRLKITGLTERRETLEDTGIF